MNFKQAIYRHCIDLLNQKINNVQAGINSIEEALQNETKSTAGDKHETSRAMMQIEREKLGNQLKELTDQRLDLEKTDINLKSDRVVKGSLVKTDRSVFFISAALGKLTIDQEVIYAISIQSPLGSKLAGLKQNERAEINGTVYSVKEIS